MKKAVVKKYLCRAFILSTAFFVPLSLYAYADVTVSNFSTCPLVITQVSSTDFADTVDGIGCDNPLFNYWRWSFNSDQYVSPWFSSTTISNSYTQVFDLNDTITLSEIQCSILGDVNNGGGNNGFLLFDTPFSITQECIATSSPIIYESTYDPFYGSIVLLLTSVLFFFIGVYISVWTLLRFWR